MAAVLFAPTLSTEGSSAARLWVDAVIAPEDTRNWLTLGLALASATPKECTQFGVFRM